MVVALLQAVLVLSWLWLDIANHSRFMLMLIGPLGCGILFSAALVFASRIPYWVSVLTLFLNAAMAAAGVAMAAPRTQVFYWFYGVPAAIVAMSLALAITKTALNRTKFAYLIAAAAVVWTGLSLLRVDSVGGSFAPNISWRWTPTAEEQLVKNQPVVTANQNAEAAWQVDKFEWPGFRGPESDSKVTEQLPRMDWTADAPKELWRRAVGPGWSSLCIVSGRLFTQEQRGEQEFTTCYNAATGDLIWEHGEISRFEDPVAGAGPRATPSYSNGRVFAFGGRAVLTALDAATGKLLWKHDLVSEVKASLPVWGFSISPVVFDDLVVIYAGGEADNGVMAFDCASGDLRWKQEGKGMVFGSAQPAEFEGQKMILFADEGRTRGIDPTSGKVLWSHVTVPNTSPAITQPQQVDDRTALLPVGDDNGIVCVELTRETDQTWQVHEKWRTIDLKPWYNDYIVHKGSVFGFDKQIFTCLDLATGKKRWKKGRYGYGQLLLLDSPEQIIVATEKGEVVLLDANAEKPTERGRFTAFGSMTWNHPVVANGRLYLRNASEMTCYQLTK